MDAMNQMPPQTPPRSCCAPGDGSGMKWMVIAVIVIALLVAAGWMFTRKETPVPAPQQESIPTAGTQTPPEAGQTPAATGNVDDIISALESAQAEEALVANAGDNDISLVTSDADAVSGMNTLYNENEF